MLTKMWMENFKSWAKTGEIRLAPLTGFFGTNSSGKSSLLQMLLLLKQTAESRDRTLVLRTSTEERDGLVDLGTLADILHSGSTVLNLGLSWTIPEKSLLLPVADTEPAMEVNGLSFETSIYFNSPEDNGVERLRYWAENFDAGMTRNVEGNYDVNLKFAGKAPKRRQARPFQNMSKPIKCYGFSDEALRFYQNPVFLNDIAHELEVQMGRIYYLGPLREYPKRVYNWAGEQPDGVGIKGELAIAALLAKAGEKLGDGRGRKRHTLATRVGQWLQDMGLVASFETRPLVKGGTQYEVRIRRSPDSAEVRITDVGFGLSQVLPVLVICYYCPRGSTIILEQPEIHLHPAVQSLLADVFIDAITTRGVQIIVESHSEHLLRRLQLRVAEEEIAANDTALYFCEYQEGQSVINPLQLDMFGGISNWPKDFFGDLTGDLLNMAQAGLERRIAANGKNNASDH